MHDRRSLSALQPTRPELAVFVSGVSSMGLEILAGRMIAPQFGSSIYTWGSIIGVFLAALSYGYHRGGRDAARRASNRRMARLFAYTALYVAVLVFAGDLLVSWTAAFPLPSRFGSLPAITLLFGPPTYFLGFVSPYAAELSEKEELGEASGHVYALGTVGSIVGAFATTFLLIPSLDVEWIGFLFGAASLATAVWLVRPSVTDAWTLGSLAVAVVLVVSASSGALGVSVRGNVVYQTQTAYQELQVVENGDTRTLYLDGQPHSAMNLEDPDRHVFEYTRYFHLPLLMTDDVDRVLFVGGGGFTGPKHFAAEYDVTVDVVEIDPEVISTAKTYFGVEESERLRVHNAGGRQFLRETNRTYDLIVLDAYRKDKVPFQLTTVEFMRLTSQRLSDDGVLFANVISAPSGPSSEFYRAEYKTMSRVYPQVYSFRTSRADVVQNIAVVASKNATRITQAELRARNERRDVGIDLSDAIDTYSASAKTDDVPVLRDDRAPVDSLLDSMAGRRYVVEENRTGNGSTTTPTASG
jgi:spermidine synthase